MFSVPGIPQSWSCIVFRWLSWCQNWVYHHRPLYVAKVGFLWTVRGTWWYPALRSSLQNTVASFKVCMRSSSIGMGCHFLIMAWFAAPISTQKRTLPFFFGVITSGEIQGVGPYTHSIIPFFHAHVPLLPLFGGCEMEFFLAVVWQDLPFCQYVIDQLHIRAEELNYWWTHFRSTFCRHFVLVLYGFIEEICLFETSWAART